MKRYISLILAFALVFSLSACSLSGGSSSVTFETDDIPNTADPLLAASETERMMVQNIYDPLLRVTDDGEILACAAESFEVSADGLTVTFRLREKQLWSDGEPVTADDFVFALRRAVDPATRFDGVDSLKNIVGAPEIMSGSASAEQLGVSADGSDTLVVKLSKADGDILFAFGGAAGIPCRKDFFEKSGGKYGMTKDTCLSNGPFYVTRWIKSEGEEAVRLTRFGDYAGTRRAAPSAVYITFEKEEGRLGRLKNGNINGGVISNENISSASDQKLLPLYSDCTVLAFSANQKALTSNADLRRALYLSADRSCLDTVLPEYCETAASVTFPGSFSENGIYALDSSTLIPERDEAAAAEAFKAAEKSLGTKKLASLRVVYEDVGQNKTVLNYSIQRWQKLFGISVEATAASAAQIPSMLSSGEYQIALCTFSPSDNFAGTALSQFSSASSGPLSGIAGEGFDRLISQSSESAVTQLSAEKYLVDNSIVLPLYFTKKYFVFDRSVDSPSVSRFSGTVDFTGMVIKD